MMRRYTPSLDGFASEEDYEEYLEAQEAAEDERAEAYVERKQMERIFNTL